MAKKPTKPATPDETAADLEKNAAAAAETQESPETQELDSDGTPGEELPKLPQINGRAAMDPDTPFAVVSYQTANQDRHAILQDADGAKLMKEANDRAAAMATSTGQPVFVLAPVACYTPPPKVTAEKKAVTFKF
jgi:hypothetical protein